MIFGRIRSLDAVLVFLGRVKEIKSPLKIVAAGCQGSDSDRYKHISRRRPVPTEPLWNWSYNANATDKYSARTTKIGGLSIGASYDRPHARRHTISTGPQRRLLADRSDARRRSQDGISPSNPS